VCVRACVKLGAGQGQPDGQPMLVAARAVVGQHLRAGQVNQLPRHHHVVRTVLA